jgi:hypothetical protein
LRLALETAETLGVGGEQIGKCLQRDVATELRVARPIDFTHPACAETGPNLERADVRTWLQRQ